MPQGQWYLRFGKGGGDVAPVVVVVVGSVMVARLEAARVEAVMVVVAMVWERDASARGRQRVWWGGREAAARAVAARAAAARARR